MLEELQEGREGKGGSIISSKEIFNICQFRTFFFLTPVRTEKPNYRAVAKFHAFIFYGIRVPLMLFTQETQGSQRGPVS